MNKDKGLQEQLKKLAEARIAVMPGKIRLSIGSSEYTKEELLEHIRRDDEVGREIIEVQVDFLRALASGSVYEHE